MPMAKTLTHTARNAPEVIPILLRRRRVPSPARTPARRKGGLGGPYGRRHAIRGGFRGRHGCGPRPAGRGCDVPAARNDRTGGGVPPTGPTTMGADMAGREDGTYEGFTAEERAAMKEAAQERRRAARRASRADKAAQAEREVVEKIASMREPDRAMAERVHAIVRATAPHLAPRLW